MDLKNYLNYETPPYMHYSSIDNFLVNRAVSIALIPAPNWAEPCLFKNPYASSCRRSGWNGEVLFIMGKIFNWTMTFIPASGYGYPGLKSPKQNTIFELLTSGRADVSGTPLILTASRAAALPHSYPLFVFPYTFVTAFVDDDPFNFQLLQPFKWDLWVTLFATVIGGFFFHMGIRKLSLTTWSRRIHKGILLLFLEVFLAWYPSLLAVDMVMKKTPPPPFKDANELADLIIEGKRRFVYQPKSATSSSASFTEVINPESLSGIPLYDKLIRAFHKNPPLRIMSRNPMAVPKALLDDPTLVYVDVLPLATQMKHMMCTATLVVDEALPSSQASVFMSVKFIGTGISIPYIDGLGDLLNAVMPEYLAKFEKLCSSDTVRKQFLATQPVKVDVWKFQSVGWFMASGFAVAFIFFVIEFILAKFYGGAGLEGKVDTVPRHFSEASTLRKTSDVDSLKPKQPPSSPGMEKTRYGVERPDWSGVHRSDWSVGKRDDWSVDKRDDWSGIKRPDWWRVPIDMRAEIWGRYPEMAALYHRAVHAVQGLKQ